jgi:non-ribosomal peptide synthetase component E (peptide arylation enzyme)/acyl carrier protein
LVPAGAEGTHPAAFSARSLRIPVVGVLSGKAAGVFTLEGRTGLAPGSGELAAPEDFAYILTTSGTTARPKLVPMPHRAACLATSISAGSMLITSADRSLNISPLFHSLGLVSGLFAPLREGGSVVCLPGFQVAQFFDQLVEYQATWFAAVPTMLQSIAEHAPSHREKLERSRLRVIRTAGAALAPDIAERVERDLRATIVHVYGMSEAPCIAGEQYPVEVRKPGSVGRASHPGVAVVDENGQPVPAGASGEIVLRGPWIIPGYYRNDAASAAVFDNGWFHTGDVGYFDTDGFLFLTGRCKEFINRGGEKVAPVEVDEVLLSHPAVVEAVTFAVPDARLGEEIAAAVVLHSENAISVAALQEFAATHLTINKVPRQIVFVNQLPKGPTGKLSRFRMAAELGLDGSLDGKDAQSRTATPGSPLEARAPEVEQKLAAIFARVLKVPHVDPHDNFFDLGGDSLTALQCLTGIQAEFGSIQVSPALFLWAPSVAQMAAAFLNPAELAHPAEVYPLQPLGTGLPFFLVTPGLEARALRRADEQYAAGQLRSGLRPR